MYVSRSHEARPAFMNDTHTQAEENIGMAMVYTLVDIVREWLLENNLAGQVCMYVCVYFQIRKI